MQKKLIALAVAGLASAGAFAQSNVTAYGVADLYVGSFKADGATRSTQVNSGGLAASRIGFKGVEDLGNGLKAVFVLEYGLAADANTGVGQDQGLLNTTTSLTASTAARQQMVALAGGFGTAAIGRLQTTAYDWAVKYDVLAGAVVSPLQSVNNRFLIGGNAVAARAPNAIAYISPSFGGVTVALNRGYISEQDVTATAKNEFAANLASISYDNGPLSLGAVWAQAKSDTGYTALPDTKVTDWSVGASYAFSFAKLSATFQKSTVDGLDSNKAWSVGAAVPVSAAGAIVASYAKRSGDAVSPGTAIKANALFTDVDQASWTLAYAHNLSKRTTAYGGYYNYNKTGADNTVDAFFAGIKHTF